MVYGVFDYAPWTPVGDGMPRTVWNADRAALIRRQGVPHGALRDAPGTHPTVVQHMPRPIPFHAGAPSGNPSNREWAAMQLPARRPTGIGCG